MLGILGNKGMNSTGLRGLLDAQLGQSEALVSILDQPKFDKSSGRDVSGPRIRSRSRIVKNPLLDEPPPMNIPKGVDDYFFEVGYPKERLFKVHV